MGTKQGWWVLIWTNHESSILQNNSCMAIYSPTSHKPSKKVEQDKLSTAEGSKEELLSDLLLWTPNHGHINVGQQAKTSIYQLCVDTGCHLKELSSKVVNRGVWGERERERQGDSLLSVRFDEWYIYIYIYIYIYNKFNKIKLNPCFGGFVFIFSPES